MLRRCCSLRCQHQAADARTDRSGPFLGLKLRWGECGTRRHVIPTWVAPWMDEVITGYAQVCASRMHASGSNMYCMVVE